MAISVPSPASGSAASVSVEPVQRLGGHQDRRHRDIEVDRKPDALARERLGDHPAGQGAVGQGLVLVVGGEGGEPLLGVEHQRVAVDIGGLLVVELEDLRVEHLALGLRSEQQEQGACRPAGGRSSAARHRPRGRPSSRHGPGRAVSWPSVILPSSSLTRARSTGSSSVSNHGFFLSQPVLRQDG